MKLIPLAELNKAVAENMPAAIPLSEEKYEELEKHGQAVMIDEVDTLITTHYGVFSRGANFAIEVSHRYACIIDMR